MALETLLVRTQRRIGTEEIFIVLDGVINESVKSDITVTRNPIEIGQDVTDHAIIQPKKYTLEGVVTDTPRIFEGISTAIVDRVTGLFGSSTDEGRSRSNSAYLTLVRLQESRIPFDIDTGFQKFTHVLIESINTSQDKNTSAAFFFTASLIQINIAETKIIPVTPESVKTPQAETGAVTAAEEGRKQKQEQSTDSILKQVKDNGIEKVVTGFLDLLRGNSLMNN